MESTVCLILGIIWLILVSVISGALWIMFLDTKFRTLNKRMVIVSIIMGVLWPIGLPIIFIVVVTTILIDVIKNN